MKIVGPGVLKADADLALIAERQMAGGSNSGDAGQLRKALEDLLLNQVSSRGIGIAGAIELRAHDEGALRIESDGRVEQLREAAKKKPAGDEEDQGQRDFADGDGMLETVPAAAEPVCGVLFNEPMGAVWDMVHAGMNPKRTAVARVRKRVKAKTWG